MFPSYSTAKLLLLELSVIYSDNVVMRLRPIGANCSITNVDWFVYTFLKLCSVTCNNHRIFANDKLVLMGKK